jgi:hypothetical protein
MIRFQPSQRSLTGNVQRRTGGAFGQQLTLKDLDGRKVFEQGAKPGLQYTFNSGRVVGRPFHRPRHDLAHHSTPQKPCLISTPDEVPPVVLELSA